MLFNDLYHIQSLTETENQIQASVLLHANHAIFRGHFPGQPVFPGVCMMEMISEITGRQMKHPFRISGAPLIKFLHMIDPQKNPLIQFEINCQSTPLTTTATGKIFFETLTFHEISDHTGPGDEDLIFRFPIQSSAGLVIIVVRRAISTIIEKISVLRIPIS